MSIAVLILGGTITMRSGAGGLLPADATEAMAALLKNSLPDQAFQVQTLLQVASASLGKADLLHLVDEIERLCGTSDISGIIVVQGTDTIEETAFLLDIAVRGTKPVVVTGAMRADALGADGPANLVAAAIVAADPRSHGRGCLVVLNDQVHLARDVQKRHTASPAAFVSPNGGPVGELAERKVRYFADASSLGMARIKPSRFADIALHTSALWDDGRGFATLSALGYEGLVLLAMGAGHVPQVMVEPLETLATTMPVILCSRTGAGPVHQHTYGYAGGEIDLLKRGLIPAGYLPAVKARILLSALVGSGATRDGIAAAFAHYQAI